MIAFTRLMFTRNPPWRACSASMLPMLAFAVLGYSIYSAGTAPADPKHLYQAWYIGAGVLVSSLAIVISGKRTKQADTMVHQLVSKIP
jgi:hypothetical protein